MRIPVLPVLTVAAVLALAGCADANQPNRTSSQSGSSAPVAANTTTCAYPADGKPAKPVDPPPTANVPTQGTVTATLKLTAGEVVITMDRQKAPCTVNNFVSLAEQGYFDNTVCHRLVDRGIFILQCGDPSATGMGGPGYSFADETTPDMTYGPGTVAMANAGRNTNGSQFFLVYGDSPLDPDYTVFGQMDKAGIDVVGGIGAQGVDAGDQTSPIAEAKIASVTLG